MTKIKTVTLKVKKYILVSHDSESKQILYWIYTQVPEPSPGLILLLQICSVYHWCFQLIS